MRQGDVVSRALTHLVGQPINIDGERAVLIGVKEKGRIVIINGPFIGLIKVHEDSELFTESDDGQTFLLASNVTGYCDPQLDSLDRDDIENE